MPTEDDKGGAAAADGSAAAPKADRGGIQPRLIVPESRGMGP